MYIQTQQVKEALRGLNKFEIINEINEGANAFAYRAKHIHLDRPVFLKVIYLDKEDQDSILRETTSSARGFKIRSSIREYSPVI